MDQRVGELWLIMNKERFSVTIEVAEDGSFSVTRVEKAIEPCDTENMIEALKQITG